MRLTILAILTFLLFSCGKTKIKKNTVYKTTDKEGYCYTDGALWYIFYLNTQGSCSFYGTASEFTSYDKNEESTWRPNAQTVADFADLASDILDAIAEVSDPGASHTEVSVDAEGGMSESSGESAGGSSEGSGSGGMSEGSGESSGGSSGDGGSSGGGGDGGGSGD